MDHARKFRADLETQDPMARVRSRVESGQSLEGLDKILRFSPTSRDAEQDGSRERGPGFSARDIAQAIDLVHEAAQSIRVAEDRARDGEARTQALLQRATEELKSAEARVQAAEARARTAETRSQEAEARLREAEDWLRQVFSAISEELPLRR
ncbi:hypothetical protein [uncultured Enterovirga sp.]|uniref:hypothetical protein n=1 Tax=uncultured Enterovirga sp. TaxID=2026352 RepID=UPI0035C97C78